MRQSLTDGISSRRLETKEKRCKNNCVRIEEEVFYPLRNKALLVFEFAKCCQTIIEIFSFFGSTIAQALSK